MVHLDSVRQKVWLYVHYCMTDVGYVNFLLLYWLILAWPMLTLTLFEMRLITEVTFLLHVFVSIYVSSQLKISHMNMCICVYQQFRLLILISDPTHIHYSTGKCMCELVCQ